MERLLEIAHENADPIIALFTVLLAIATFFLWKATRDLVKGSERNARHELRAYLFMKDPKIEGVAPGETPKATILIKNYGKTPAYGVTAITDVGFDSYPKATASGIAPVNELSRGDLGPGGELVTTVARQKALTTAEIEGIKAGHYALYVVTTVNFTDAFEQKWVYHISLMFTYRSFGKGRLEVCPEGNHTEKA